MIVGMLVFAGTLYLALIPALFGWRGAVGSTVGLIVAVLVAYVVFPSIHR